MKLNQYFQVQELVPETVFKQWGANSIWFLDKRLVDSLFWLRQKINVRLVVNNWVGGGDFQNRGFRLPDTTVGGKLSQHKFGRAVDFHSLDMPVPEIYKWIKKNEKDILKNTAFTTIESEQGAPTWVHLDCRYSNDLTHLTIVNP